jgi:SAM-dependent methyltransferase
MNPIKKVLLKIDFLVWLVQRYRRLTKQIFNRNKKCFEGKNALEIGGPTPLFMNKNPIPIYNILKSCDNVNWSDDNVWSSIKHGADYIVNSKKYGKQIILDSSDLSNIKKESYDLILSSHSLEHLANPLKALFEWYRVLKPDGYILIVVPDKRYTYDRLRPLTEFKHIIDDYNSGIGEDDNTHFSEVLELHDLTNDGNVDNYPEHERRTLNNFETRVVHHHTFDEKLLNNLLTHVGFKIIDNQVFRPYHIVAVATKAE